MLDHFFLLGTPIGGIEAGRYSLFLVFLSYVVASLASYMALDFAGHLRRKELPVNKNIILMGGAFALGAGIWSMHFVGMLAFHMDMAMSYDPLITFFSLIIAVIVAYFVLDIIQSRKITPLNIGASSILLGLGICAMHYTGMAAMQMDAALLYKPALFALSVFIAVAASAAALMIAFNIPTKSRYETLYKLVAASVMGVAICGMHYTGMEAAVFIPFADCRYAPDQTFDLLAFSITIVASLILGGALNFSAHIRQFKVGNNLFSNGLSSTTLVYASLVISCLVLLFLGGYAFNLKLDIENTIFNYQNNLDIENSIKDVSHQISSVFYLLVPSLVFLIWGGLFSMRSLKIWRQEVERLALFPENDPMPIMEIDAQKKISYANQSALRIFPDIQNNGKHPLLKSALEIIDAKMGREHLDISHSEIQIKRK